jgi:hypothetical protein
MRFALVAGMLAIILGGPVVWHIQQKKTYRNFRIVEPGMLYRSGKLSRAGLDDIIRRFGIRTVVNFRAFESGDQPDPEEEAFCRERGIRYERIVYRKWQSPDGGPIPGDRSVAEYCAVMDRRREIGPILIHCLAGKHRTGAFTAIHRMEYQKWPNSLAIEEMQSQGYEGIANEDDVRGYLERYVPRERRLPR